ncbi:F-box domain-containing protein [Heracleum sosnowskyi]|uniref:F-box domain-containing protein n=1 Tax=Heracleum sosnowskyi TaxID=360622 RepID=A0AAD8HMD9_9APIA|nr:F-box domain-containing protein [Heracleum sosnowskyi]
MNSDSTPFFDMLTSDLITEILVRLPRTGTDQALIIKEGGNSIFVLHLDSCVIGGPLGDIFFVSRLETGGCCNGIVCLWHAQFFYNNKSPYTYLWNPATKQAKLVPDIPPRNIKFNNIIAFIEGFGFDPVDDEYKVVALMKNYLGQTWIAEVYSANANVWRRVEPNPQDLPSDGGFDVCVNGFLCCVGLHCMGMLAFDLNKEVFICGIKLPNGYSPIRITDFNDSIAVTASKECMMDNVVNLWKLDDEACLRDSRVEASWTLMLSIDVGHPVKCVSGYFNSGDLLLRTDEDDDWILFNSDKKEARNVPVSFDDRRTLKYNESLVSITRFERT